MRRLNSKRLLRDIEETANPKTRLERVRAAITLFKDRLSELGREATELENVRRELVHHPGHGGARIQLGALKGAWLLLVVLDIPVQFLLNHAALPGVETGVVALGSVSVALAITGLAHVVAVALLYDHERPARSMRLCRMLAGLSFLAIAAGAGIFLFARQASAEMVPYIVTLTSVSLWTVAEALPLSAGFFSAWAHILAEPRRAQKRIREVESNILACERLLARLQEEDQFRTIAHVQCNTIPRLQPLCEKVSG